jgi:hypothetical protein
MIRILISMLQGTTLTLVFFFGNISKFEPDCINLQASFLAKMPLNATENVVVV